MFLQLPSLLVPFWTDGSPGTSMVLFANATSRDKGHDDRSSWGADVLKDGTIQIIIAPLVKDEPLDPAVSPAPLYPRWLECSIPDYATLGEARAVRSEADWFRDFLYTEPVLPGRFSAGDKPGGLAISYRSASGQVRFIGLNHEPGDVWKLGGKTCETLTIEKDGKKKRDVWMLKLN